MDIVGYSYTQERSFDTLEGAARNPGSSSTPIMGTGMGLGMGVGPGQNICPNCGTSSQKGQSFCGECEYCGTLLG